MGQVRLYRKDLDVTYVYESKSYWDKEEKKHKSKRRLIGKIDPATGEIVPTRSGKKKEAPASEVPADAVTAEKKGSDAAESEQLIRDLRADNERLQKENASLKEQLGQYHAMTAKVLAVISEMPGGDSAR